MKPSFVLLPLITLLLAACGSTGYEASQNAPATTIGSTAEGPVSYYGEMVALGNRLYGSKTNRPFAVRGLSLFWSCNDWGHTHWWNAETVDKLVDEWKIEIIRAALCVEEAGGYLEDPESNLERLHAVVKAAIAQDIYVIIDWHSHHAEQNTEAAVAFFEAMAQEYGDEDHVIFEIYNEPLSEGDGMTWPIIKAYAEEVIPAIRKHSDNLIVVGTKTWSQNVDEPARDPILAYNIAYTLHFYIPNHGTPVKAHLDVAMERDIAVFATEWGFWFPEDWGHKDMTAEDWLAVMDEHQISWCSWSVSDKEEPSSIWNKDGSVTENGLWLKGKLHAYAETAEWRQEP